MNEPVTAEMLGELYQRAQLECARVGVALSMGQSETTINVISEGAYEALLAYSTAREIYQQQQRPWN